MRLLAARHADIELDPDERLVDSRHRAPGIEWPLAVDKWLDAQVAMARRAGWPRPTRQELVAALMTAVSRDADELFQLLVRYNRMTNGELLGVEPGAVLTFAPPRPGRRPTRRQP